ncbi:MAG: hypothetical protein H6707_01025 [Deltaproteobacteria bacterium]|nr:hypothetical protein [Deltaproteobacteria bacterium]
MEHRQRNRSFDICLSALTLSIAVIVGACGGIDGEALSAAGDKAEKPTSGPTELWTLTVKQPTPCVLKLFFGDDFPPKPRGALVDAWGWAGSGTFGGSQNCPAEAVALADFSWHYNNGWLQIFYGDRQAFHLTVTAKGVDQWSGTTVLGKHEAWTLERAFSK